MTLLRLRLGAVILLIAALCSSGCGRRRGSDDTGPSPLPKAAVVVPSSAVAPSESCPSACPAREAPERGGAPFSFASLAKAVDAGVVTIVSLVERRSRTGRPRMVREGLGTGFVYDRAGLVLTNNHVVEGANEITVKLADGRELTGKILGTDKPADVAVLRVDERNLTPLTLGNSDSVEVGDWVVAIGNPFGLSHTVSAGILSARGRTHDDVQGLDPSGYFNFLQTDAAINQGNSGGPLLNLRGEVVGINAAIRANANSIGFAIPINMVKQLLPILLREGKVTRSALGAIVASLNDAEAVRLKRPDHKGAWIKMVIPGHGAARAGLSADDVVVQFDGRPIADPNELRWVASLGGVGKTVVVRVQRGARTFDVPVTLGPLEAVQDEEDRGSARP